MARKIAFDDLSEEYADLWTGIQIRETWRNAVSRSAAKIVQHKDRYEAVARQCGDCPWFFIGIIHQMESGQRWDKHLHNGDSLSRRTRRVPANRPKTHKGPFTWEESAIDALTMKGFHKIRDWSLPRIAYELERYNGFGYRLWHAETLSPYLWSGTTHYRRGKYVADGKWSASAISGQTGGMALLRHLMDANVDIMEQFRPVRVPAAPAINAEAETQPEDFVPTPEAKPVREAIKSSGTIFGILTGALGTLINWFDDIASVVIEGAAKTTEWTGAAHSTLSGLGFSTAGVATSLTVGGLVWAATRRLNAASKGKIG